MKKKLKPIAYVKMVSCSSGNYWHSQNIGACFWVVKSEDRDSWRVLKESCGEFEETLNFLYKKDCKIILKIQ